MRNINTLFYSYSDKVDKLYDKEFELNETLNLVIKNAIADLQMLNRKSPLTTLTMVCDLLVTNQGGITFKEVQAYSTADANHPNYSLYTFKIRQLYTSYTRLRHSNTRLASYKQMKIPYVTFNVLNTAINGEISKSILRGYTFRLGLGEISVGKILVEKIERKFDEDGTPSDKSINWAESNSFKQSLIDKGIEVYNKETNPNGRKWFIFHSEPYIYYINWQISMYAHKNIKYFKLEPNSFINTKNRLSSDVLDDYSVDVEDIINNSKLGFMNKLNILLKKDPSYALKYEKLTT